jgi:glutamyl-tRNA reductase
VIAAQPNVPVKSASVRAMVAHARAVPSARREAFASSLDSLGDGPDHVLVHTCHRVELYLAPGAFGRPLPDLPAGAQVLEDASAARHLIAVACGLDSAVFGETQILHQLRETIAERQGERALDPVLDRLFQAALRAGRTAHGWYSGPPRSLADVALDRIAEHIGSVDERRILVVGVGKMGRLAAFATARRGARVTVTNRGPERAAALAREVSGETLPFAIDGTLSEIEGVIVAISGQWPVGPGDVQAIVDRRVPVVDLSSPPAIPEALQVGLRERFVSVDDLAAGDGGPNQRLRQKLEKLISETGRDYCHWIRTRDAVPAIQAMVASAEQLRQAEVEWLLRRLPALGPDDAGAVEQMSHRLVAAILHAPLVALNEDASGDLERAARELFGV